MYTPEGLRKALARFGIVEHLMTKDGVTEPGYYRNDFIDALERRGYISSEEASKLRSETIDDPRGPPGTKITSNAFQIGSQILPS